jgi:hypothetical protein
LQLPGGGAPLQASGKFGSAFLLDVHMDSGRLLKPWVSSLGAFWPAMQALAGELGPGVQHGIHQEQENRKARFVRQYLHVLLLPHFQCQAVCHGALNPDM